MTLAIVSTASPLWYPQWMSHSSSGTVYWDSTNLDIASAGYTSDDVLRERAVFKNYGDYGSEPTHCFNSGCFLCASALIIANMNLSTTSTKHDIRLLEELTASEYTAFQNLTATSTSSLKPSALFSDPYSAFLSLNNLSGKHYSFHANGTYLYKYTTNISVYVSDYTTLLSKFKSGGTVSEILISGISSSASLDENYEVLLSAISTALANNPEGILLTVASNHAVVVRNINGYPRVFDSGRNGNSIVGQYYNVPLYTYFVSAQVRSMNTITKYRVFN